MAWRYEVQIPKTLRLVRRRLRALMARWPVLRKQAPLALSLVLNIGFAVLLLALTQIREVRGTPGASLEAVEVTLIPVEAFPQAELSETEAADPEAEEADQQEETVEVAREENPQEAPEVTDILIPETPPPPPPVAEAPADIEVPEVDTARGALDGIVALDCDREFDDRQRAAECAGAEIRTDWRSAYEARDDEQWARSAERLRQGRYRGPFAVGPDQYGRLGQNEELYRPADPRFRLGPGPTSGGGGANYAAAFESREEYERYLRLYDSRTYIGQNQGLDDGYSRPWGEPMSGWRPSWQLREDPHIDNKALGEFLDSIEEQEEQ